MDEQQNNSRLSEWVDNETQLLLYLGVNLDTRQKHVEANGWKNIYCVNSKLKQTGVVILISRQTDLKAKC